MKQLEVQIMGQSYLLGCPEGGEVKLLEAVERVDTAMCKIRDAGKSKARDRIAVLAALNLAFDHQQQSQSATPPAPEPLSSDERELDLAQAEQRLSNLLQRLDQALGGSGLLL